MQLAKLTIAGRAWQVMPLPLKALNASFQIPLELLMETNPDSDCKVRLFLSDFVAKIPVPNVSGEPN